MPSRSKKQSTTIVVRPITRGTRQATKTVLGTLGELNRHAPLKELNPALVSTPPKPWKQNSRPYVWEPDVRRRSRRNPGREDGQTWRSDSYLCGRALESSRDDREVIDDTTDCEEGSSTQDWREGIRRDSTLASHSPPRREVPIMDIAKPMKPRGMAKDFEVLETVGRVIALDDDHMTEWTDDDRGDSAMQEWESLDWESASDHEHKASYAAMLRQRPD
ncbi:hypothetical protein FKP32DRAFT_1760641 [Trametes sanguinea]|nr:hypothetical protein FKP32DRAFT_1760641 [Trametes sanguinea]